MKYVLDNLRESDDRVLSCARCETPLGSADEGVRRLAGTFDLSLDVGQPADVAPGTSRYALRHYGCRSCGALFDVETVSVEDASAAPA